MTRKRIVSAALGALALAAIVSALVIRGRGDAAARTAAGKPGAPAPEGRSGAAAGAARVTPVLVAEVERRDVPLWVEGIGTVAAWQQATVRPQVDGRLDRVLFREGQRVRRGSSLAQIDARPFLVELHQAQGALARDRAQLDGARKNLARMTTLRETSLVAQQQVDDLTALVGQLEGTVRTDQAAIERARLQLDFARVRAPIDGVVGVRLVDPGNIVKAADPGGLAVIAQLDPAAVYFTAPQDELGRIAAAQAAGPVTVEVLAREGGARLGTGHLVVIDNQINTATSTLRLKARVPNPAGSLWPNQFVKARLLAATLRGVAVVPAVALQRGPQGNFVYVVAGTGDDLKAEQRPIELERITGEVAIVARGLAPGERVVVEGQGQLRPGAPVAARPAQGAATRGQP